MRGLQRFRLARTRQSDVVVTVATEAELREALDDLWSCIAANEIGHLQEGTIEVAAVNHMRLWHENPRDVVPTFAEGREAS